MSSGAAIALIAVGAAVVVVLVVLVVLVLRALAAARETRAPDPGTGAAAISTPAAAGRHSAQVAAGGPADGPAAAASPTSRPSTAAATGAGSAMTASSPADAQTGAGAPGAAETGTASPAADPARAGSPAAAATGATPSTADATGAGSPAAAAETARLKAELAGAKATVAASEAELDRLRARLAKEQEQAARAQAGRAEEAHRITEEAARLSSRQARLVEREERFSEREDRMTEREDRLVEREERFAADLAAAQRAKQELAGERAQVEQERAGLEEAAKGIQLELERIAGLTAEAAAREVVAGIEDHAKRQAAITVRDIETEARRDADRRAREITSQAIQRVAGPQTTESVVSVLHLPSEEMKGRIIGREGRNIRAFETLTGVNVLIDDTPEAVALSCFDPVRREVARVALGTLVADGRIHPQRIEDAYEQARTEVESTIDATGHDVLLEVDITDVHPELITLLGRLRYRTSYGQNVLRHLVETAHIASGMAAELGLGREGVSVVKRAAFFHDIGKALTHEVEGSHALVGADVARRCGESEEVVHAIAAHHLEVPPQTVEAWLTIGSDSCSGGRPGARRESLEAYVERLKRIEEIAHSRDGVERVYAMSAGRELRVMVLPDEVDDLGAQVLARDIAKQIEDELTYPGQVRVTVVRESRATETAH